MKYVIRLPTQIDRYTMFAYIVGSAGYIDAHAVSPRHDANPNHPNPSPNRRPNVPGVSESEPSIAHLTAHVDVPMYRIDYALLSPGFRDSGWQLARAYVHQAAPSGSDHFPIVCDLVRPPVSSIADPTRARL